MKKFIILAVIIVVTSLIMAFSTEMSPGSNISQTHVLGIPVVSLGEGDFAWLSVGAGTGVLVVGAAGVGVVVFGFIGAGVLFGTGQAACGLIAFGQAAVGLVLVLGQLGLGLVGAGQVIIGGLGWAQGRLAFDGEEFLQKLNADFNRTLSFGSGDG